MTLETQLENRRPVRLPYLLAPVPALAVGVLIMRMSDVPAGVWGQNLAAWVVGTLLCLGLWRTRSSSGRGRWIDFAAVLTLAALAATLLAPDVDGVHRWLPLGPVRLHAAAVLLPLLLVAMQGLSQARGWWISTGVAVGVALVLLLQPDAAQATAFAAGCLVLLLPSAGRDPLRLACVLALPVLAALTWLRSDPLAPVPHVEGIVGLAAGLGAVWAVAAVVSLLVLPLPFFLAGRGAGKHAGLALAVYITITLLAPFVGSFPVPVMGYGVSPILGYLVGLGILMRTAPSGGQVATAMARR
jgi:cell division protein FtsW (lipid II flippase)